MSAVSRRKLKQKLVIYKGGRCETCGYNKPCFPAYDFHHIDPSKKDFTICEKVCSFEKARKEVDKCLLLCRNCHAELHDELNKNLREEQKKLREKQKPKKKVLVCATCGKNFSGRKKYCSNKCRLGDSKILPKSILSDLVWKKYSTEIAKELGVSDRTIGTWCEKYGIKKPPKGYWQKNPTGG